MRIASDPDFLRALVFFLLVALAVSLAVTAMALRRMRAIDRIARALRIDEEGEAEAWGDMARPPAGWQS